MEQTLPSSEVVAWALARPVFGIHFDICLSLAAERLLSLAVRRSLDWPPSVIASAHACSVLSLSFADPSY